MFNIKSNEGYFLHLIKSALKDEQPIEKPDEVNWEYVLRIAERQNAANLCWFSIEKLNNKPDGELYTYWQDVYAKAASKCLQQMMEIDFLSEEFTKRGYDICFLKGSKIREYYPSPDMRTMTDIDLLVRAQDRKPIRELMKSLGYEEDLMDDGQVDAFKKLPVIYTEIHYDFSAENHVYHEYFTIDWDKLVETQTPHVFEMTYEDLYFFNVGHYVKNMSKVGMGIRSIVDCFVLWNSASEKQKENILKKFENTELKAFNDNLLKIAGIWFCDADDDGTLDNVQHYLLETKTYGKTGENEAIMLIESKQNDKSKTSFIIRRIFPKSEELFKRFNVKRKNVLLIPFLWLARIILLVFSGKEKKEKVKKEYSAVKDISSQEIEYETIVRKEIGLL
ncbi:MAG: nucleotidyltransferase family protein [Eubacterium sp.]|nr:nucleotidyltransferase family protein [Eubacterium sp.]